MLNPHYVVGFVDGEGCFSVSISRKRFRVPEVRLIFEIELREDDEPILREIQQMLCCGSIHYLGYDRYKKWRPHVKLKVGSFKDIKQKVIPFFLRYPLQAKKKKQFEFFCKIAEMVERSEHRSQEGVQRIIELREEYRDSLDARDAHVQWGSEGFLPKSPPVKRAKSGAPEDGYSNPQGRNPAKVSSAMSTKS